MTEEEAISMMSTLLTELSLQYKKALLTDPHPQMAAAAVLSRHRVGASAIN